MKNIFKVLSLASVASVMAVSALAAHLTTINNLPKRGNVSVEGTVDTLNGGNLATIKDNTGYVGVLVNKDEYEDLRVGERVTVTGSVKSGRDGMLISARSVINQDKTKASPAQTDDINAGNSTGEDQYNGMRGPQTR